MQYFLYRLFHFAWTFPNKIMQILQAAKPSISISITYIDTPLLGIFSSTRLEVRSKSGGKLCMGRRSVTIIEHSIGRDYLGKSSLRHSAQKQRTTPMYISPSLLCIDSWQSNISMISTLIPIQYTCGFLRSFAILGLKISLLFGD